MPVVVELRVGILAFAVCWLLTGLASAQQRQTDQSNLNQSPRGELTQSGSSQSDRSSPVQNGRSSFSASAQSAPSSGGAASGNQSRGVEQYVAACLLTNNEADLKLSQFAQQHGRSSEVKEFAKMMVQDHEKMIQQLQRLSGAHSSAGQSDRSSVTGSGSGRSSAVTSGESTTQSFTRNETDAGSSDSPGGGLSVNSLGAGGAAAAPATASDRAVHELMQIDRQVIERKTQATREELQRDSGAEFDKAFVRTAISAHIDALAALEVIGQQSQGQLAQLAQQARPTVRQHLEHAKKLMKKLEGEAGNSETASRRPDSNDER
jgi:predicted outer membrane protein